MDIQIGKRFFYFFFKAKNDADKFRPVKTNHILGEIKKRRFFISYESKPSK